MAEQAIRDQNHVTAMLFKGSDGATYNAQGDQATGRLKVDLAGSAGTVTSVSVVSANGFAGSVATATTTPAITLTTTINAPVLAGNGTAIAAATTTGSGSTVVLATSPTLVTPVLGVATATSINGLTITSSTGVLTITNAKTLAVTNTLTLSGTDSTIMTFPTTSATIARTDAANTFTGTQTIGALVATTVNGNTFTTGTGVLTIAASKTLTISNTITLAGTDGKGINVGAATSRKILVGDGTNMVLSTETYAVPGTSGNILTSDGTNWTSAAPAASGSTTVDATTDFSVTTRFSTTIVGSAANALQVWGFGTNTGATNPSSIENLWRLNPNTAFDAFSSSPLFSCSFGPGTIPTSGQVYIGIGSPTIAGAGITFTDFHIGFKILIVAGVASLYATQGDGGTENASSALTTLAASDAVEVILKVNGSSSVDYYWRKNGGSLSSATNLTSNLPDTTTNTQNCSFSLSNANSTSNVVINLSNARYSR